MGNRSLGPTDRAQSGSKVRSKCIFDDSGEAAQVHHHVHLVAYVQVHHHVHHHMHLHHHSPSEGNLLEKDDEEEDEGLTPLWEPGFPVLTKDFFNSRMYGRKSMIPPSGPASPQAQARDFFRVEEVIWCGFFSIVVICLVTGGDGYFWSQVVICLVTGGDGYFWSQVVICLVTGGDGYFWSQVVICLVTGGDGYFW
ncbi:hypothetical protein ACOMHN_043082 [Nucella lapillus]